LAEGKAHSHQVLKQADLHELEWEYSVVLSDQAEISLGMIDDVEEEGGEEFGKRVLQICDIEKKGQNDIRKSYDNEFAPNFDDFRRNSTIWKAECKQIVC